LDAHGWKTTLKSFWLKTSGADKIFVQNWNFSLLSFPFLSARGTQWCEKTYSKWLSQTSH
jgi:hypothetical protein